MLESSEINEVLYELRVKKTSLLERLQTLENGKDGISNYFELRKSVTDELAILNSQMSTYTVLYKNCVDLILMKIYREKFGEKVFNELYLLAQQEYKKRK
jgi:hypothetical protein